MCCSTGVCGPEVDPALVRFASDLERLKENGVEVERFNLSQEPAKFAAQPAVTEARKPAVIAVTLTRGATTLGLRDAKGAPVWQGQGMGQGSK
jgi:hypothetical protein